MDYDERTYSHAVESLKYMRSMISNFEFSRKLEKTCPYPGFLTQREESALYLQLLCQTISDLVPKIVPYYLTRNFPKRIDPRVIIFADHITPSECIVSGMSEFCGYDGLRRLAETPISVSLLAKLQEIVKLMKVEEIETKSISELRTIQSNMSGAVVEFHRAYIAMFD